MGVRYTPTLKGYLMFDPVYLIPLTFILTVIGYTILLGLLWHLFMPAYLYGKIRETIADCTTKSCFNCRFFNEQYYDSSLWCSEVGLPIDKVHCKCNFWQLRTFEEAGEPSESKL